MVGARNDSDLRCIICICKCLSSIPKIMHPIFIICKIINLICHMNTYIIIPWNIRINLIII